MKIQKKEPEAFIFDGQNFDELKKHFPQLVKYTFRKGHEYTIGWKTGEGEEEGFTEAIAGFYLVKGDGPDKILEPDEFNKLYNA